MIYTEPFGADRRRAGQFDDLPLYRPGEDGGGPVRSRTGGGHVADLFPRHPVVLLGVLHGDDSSTRRAVHGEVRTNDSQCMLKVNDRLDCLHHVPDAADLLAGEHELQDQQRDSRPRLRCGRRISRWTTTSRSLPIRPGTMATSTRSST